MLLGFLIKQLSKYRKLKLLRDTIFDKHRYGTPIIVSIKEKNIGVIIKKL